MKRSPSWLLKRSKHIPVPRPFCTMTATFLLPFAIGACTSVGGNIVTDAFGVVAMVAMTPLITIQILGLVFELNSRYLRKMEAKKAAAAFARLPDDEIIEL